jgi:hypothetical protein
MSQEPLDTPEQARQLWDKLLEWRKADLQPADELASQIDQFMAQTTNDLPGSEVCGNPVWRLLSGSPSQRKEPQPRPKPDLLASILGAVSHRFGLRHIQLMVLQSPRLRLRPIPDDITRDLEKGGDVLITDVQLYNFYRALNYLEDQYRSGNWRVTSDSGRDAAPLTPLASLD